MKFGLYGLLSIGVLLFNSGCASLSEKKVQADVILTASASSQIQPQAGLSKKASRFKAEQKAALSAYRQLARLLYQQTTHSGQSIAGQVVKDEVFRVYLDTFLRGAKMQSRRLTGGSQVSLKLTVTDQFRSCMDDVATVKRCLRDENKLAFTRIGFRQATAKTVNLACAQPDCSGQFSISGFSRKTNRLDRMLLNAGLYDSEWMLNSSARVLGNYLLITAFPPK